MVASHIEYSFDSLEIFSDTHDYDGDYPQDINF